MRKLLTPEFIVDPLGRKIVKMEQGNYFDIHMGESERTVGNPAHGLTIRAVGDGVFRITGWQGISISPVDCSSIYVTVPPEVAIEAAPREGRADGN